MRGNGGQVSSTPGEAFLGLKPAHRSAVEAPRGRRGEGPLEAPFTIEHLDPELQRHPVLKPIAQLGLPPYRRNALRRMQGFVRLPALWTGSSTLTHSISTARERPLPDPLDPSNARSNSHCQPTQT